MIFRWVFFAILAVLLVSWLFSMRLPWVEKLGLTKLRSHFSFNFRGRVFRIPVTTAIVLMTVLFALVHYFYDKML